MAAIAAEKAAVFGLAPVRPSFYARDMPPRAVPPARNLGPLLREARERAQLSREDVVFELRVRGRRTGVNTLVRWEKDGSIRLDDARALAAVYGITLDELAALAPSETSAEALAALAEEREAVARAAKDREGRGGTSGRRAAG